jgi:hypothetical protein
MFRFVRSINLFHKYIPTLVCRIIDVHVRLLILRKNSPLHRLILACTLIVFEKKLPLHVYSILHGYWYLPCTFINFEKKIPLPRLMFFKNFPTCTFILPYLSIWHTRVLKFLSRLLTTRFLSLFNAIIHICNVVNFC